MFQEFISSDVRLQVNMEFLNKMGLSTGYLYFSMTVLTDRALFEKYAQQFRLRVAGDRSGFRKYMMSTFDTYLKQKNLEQRYASFLARTLKKRALDDQHIRNVYDLFLKVSKEPQLPGIRDVRINGGQP